VKMSNKLGLGSNKMTETRCISCENEFLQAVGSNPAFPNSQVYECCPCKLALTYPLPTAQQLFDFYQVGFYDKRSIEEFNHLLENNFEKILAEQAFREKRAAAQFKFMQPYLPKQIEKKALDIGCSAGSLLVILAQHGFQVTGYEPDHKMANFANRRLGNKDAVIPRMLDLDELQDNSYDLICSSHLLEHVSDPVKHLTSLRRSLTKDGVLFIEIPNEYAMDIQKCINPQINEMILEQGHLYFYSRESIERLLNLNGFCVLDIKTCGINASDYLEGLQFHKDDELNLKPKPSIVSRSVQKVLKRFKPSQQTPLPDQTLDNTLEHYWDSSQQGIWIRVIASLKEFH
jgi:SAM-dependent methyltransferase